MRTRITRTMTIVAGAVLTAGVLAAASADSTVAVTRRWHPSAAQYARTIDIPSHNRRYRASLTFDAGAASDSFTGRITITDQGGRAITGARLRLESMMPDHDRVPHTRPMVMQEMQGGIYRVRGLRFDREGLWTVRLTIAAPSGGDSLAFNLIR